MRPSGLPRRNRLLGIQDRSGACAILHCICDAPTHRPPSRRQRTNRERRVCAILVIEGGSFLLADAALTIGAITTAYDIGPFLTIVGVIFLVLAGVEIIISIGLWRGNHWAWTTPNVILAIGLVLAIPLLVVEGGFVALIINASIVYYLTRPNVKDIFRD